VGASRYPDYGPAAVAGAVLAAGLPAGAGLALGGLLGLALAELGGWSIVALRGANARAIVARAAALDAGDAGAIGALQAGGIARDALRGMALTAAGLAVGAVAQGRVPPEAVALPVAALVTGAGLAAALHGAWRGQRVAWLGAGVAAGVLAAAVLG
ncbi:MAG: hypothetical protein NW201_07455, partial [Gemmatimonadales bacterium]|nr:hypothetical protein [Gemmatimonadales bacterium]